MTAAAVNCAAFCRVMPRCVASEFAVTTSSVWALTRFRSCVASIERPPCAISRRPRRHFKGGIRETRFPEVVPWRGPRRLSVLRGTRATCVLACVPCLHGRVWLTMPAGEPSSVACCDGASLTTASVVERRSAGAVSGAATHDFASPVIHRRGAVRTCARAARYPAVRAVEDAGLRQCVRAPARG